MGKQQSDHIENRFREAAENISVPLNEKAWEKMELLLDKEKRRRPLGFWWYLLFVAIIAGSGIVIYNSFSRNQTARADYPSSDAGSSSTSKNYVQSPQAGASSVNKARNGVTVQKTAPDEISAVPLPSGQIAGTPSSVKREAAVETPKVKASTTGRLTLVETKYGKEHHSPNNFRPAKSRFTSSTAKVRSNTALMREASESESATPPADEVAKTVNAQAPPVTTEKQAATVDSATTAVKKESEKEKLVSKDSAARTTIKITPAKSKWKLGPGFNVSFIADINSTTLHHYSLHEFKPLFGAGLGYRFSNRLSLQTGFMVQKAIYFADADDYEVKAGSYLSMYRIMKIDATCLLYEIPLTLRYDLLTAKNFRIYSTAGFESYFLKKENYKYHLTGSSGYRMLDSTFTTNKNIFASSYLSLGLEQKITPSFSVQVEPYLKVPISGVGEGKVKLYSAGMQLSLKFQPVKKTAPRK